MRMTLESQHQKCKVALMEFTPGQCRAARALIGWSQDQLASASKVAKATIANFELCKRVPYDRTLDDLVAALEAAGIEFTNGKGPGVRLSPLGIALGSLFAIAASGPEDGLALAKRSADEYLAPNGHRPREAVIELVDAFKNDQRSRTPTGEAIFAWLADR
jgi:transcriptional regulator with XRE-family HTH domain